MMADEHVPRSGMPTPQGHRPELDSPFLDEVIFADYDSFLVQEQGVMTYGDADETPFAAGIQSQESREVGGRSDEEVEDEDGAEVEDASAEFFSDDEDEPEVEDFGGGLDELELEEFDDDVDEETLAAMLADEEEVEDEFEEELEEEFDEAFDELALERSETGVDEEADEETFIETLADEELEEELEDEFADESFDEFDEAFDSAFAAPNLELSETGVDEEADEELEEELEDEFADESFDEFDEAFAVPSEADVEGVVFRLSARGIQVPPLDQDADSSYEQTSSQIAENMTRIADEIADCGDLLIRHRNSLSEEQVDAVAHQLRSASQGVKRIIGSVNLSPGPPSPAADASAAVSPFNFFTRLSMPASLLSPSKNADALRWNQRNHPRVSGVDPAHIRTDLSRYMNLTRIAAEITAYNASHPASPISIGTPPIDAVFVEAVHQFQAKCFFEPSQIDGKAGESTLDSLGIVRRRGLNRADQTNQGARRRLRRADVSAQTNGEFTAEDWFTVMVNPTFLGWRFTSGIHLILVRRLRIAERWLLSLPQFAGKTPVELGRALGFDNRHEKHKGGRPRATSRSIHTYGLAMDIKYSSNPYVRGKRFTAALKHSALLLSGVRIPQRTSQAFFHSLGSDPALSTERIFEELARRDADLRRYLGLYGNRASLREILAARRVDGTRGIFTTSRESLNRAEQRWRRRIRRDLRYLRARSSPYRKAGGRLRDPLEGFLNFPKELVIALRDKACLAWGAVDFGTGQNGSGDIMHFDARVCGLGDRLADIGGNFRVRRGHPCLPCASSPSNPAADELAEFLDESPDEAFDDGDEAQVDEEKTGTVLEESTDEWDASEALVDVWDEPELDGEREEEFHASLLSDAFLFDQEIVDGQDTRNLLSNTLAVPFRWICALDLCFENPKYGGRNEPQWLWARGSGTLIGPRHILTAAHVLTLDVDGRQLPVKKIVAAPARHGAKRRLGRVQAEAWVPSQHWRPERQNREQDFAVIKLEKAIGLKRYRVLKGERLGWWGSKDWGHETVLKELRPTFLNGRRVGNAGYPGDKCGTRPRRGSASKTQIRNCIRRTPELYAANLWGSAGRLQNVKSSNPLMHHTIDTYEGQSGSPIWYRYKQRRWLVGIHVDRAHPGANLAVRVTQKLLDEVARIRRELDSG